MQLSFPFLSYTILRTIRPEVMIHDQNIPAFDHPPIRPFWWLACWARLKNLRHHEDQTSLVAVAGDLLSQGIVGNRCDPNNP